MNVLNPSRSFGALAIVMALGIPTAYAADPCPWEGTENAAACAQWEVMAQRLEAAEARAEAAEEALTAMEGALKSMENAIQDMQAGSATSTTEQTQQQISGSEATSAETAPAAAAETSTSATDDPQQQQAKNFIEKLLSSLTMQTMGLEVEGGFIIDRDYELVQDGDAYTTTLDEAAFAVEELRIDFGPITIGVAPVDDDTSNVSMRFGDTIKGQEGGQELFSLSIGEQDISGLWSEKAQNFLDANSQLQNLKLIIAGEDFNADVGSLGITQKIALGDDDTWNQEQNLAVSNILLSGEGNSVSLDDISGQFSMSGRNYSRLINIGEEIQTMVESSIGADEPPAELFDFIGEIFALFDGYSFDLSAQNLDVSSGGMPIGTASRIGLSSDLAAAENNTSRFTYKMDMSGFDTQMAPLPPNVLPRETKLEIALSQIPDQVIKRFIEIGMGSEKLAEEEKDAYFQQQFMALIMSSALQFDIIDSFIAAEATRLDLSAHAEVNQQSAVGGTGSVSLKVENMQTLIDITGAAQQPSIAPVLAMITAFSDRTEQDGKTVDNFDLEFTAEGKLMLNGKDITGMIMPGAAPPQ